MGFLGQALSLFQKHPRLRQVWLHIVKFSIGFGLKFNLIPSKNRLFFGRIHDWIRRGSLEENQQGFDRSFDLENSSICNAKCSFCSYPILDFPRKIMNEETFVGALDMAKAMKIKDLDFTPYLGENFVDPRFISRIRATRAALPDAVIRFTTNGTFLAQCNLEELLNSGVSRINVSFGVWGREDYQKLYNIDAWDRVYAGVVKLLETKERLGSKVFIALWFRPLNSNSNAEIKNFLEKFGHVIDDTHVQEVYYDILSISGKQPKHIQIERQFDATSLKATPCAHLGKVACGSTGNWFSCFCVISDCYKQDQSWFYLGPPGSSLDTLNAALSEKTDLWKRGEIPQACRSCLFYVPVSKDASITY
jgi:sulfatase maturation enzyme AslB (radical SAM superfamily)